MKLLYSADTIQSRVADLAATLSRELAGAKLVHVVVTMNGSFMFASDLCRQLSIPQVLHFTGGSYFQGAIKQEMALNSDTLPTSFNHCPVLIIEDILDTGGAIRQLRHLLAERQAGPITVVSLFKRMNSAGQTDHAAFTLPREIFVVGYGLDMDGRFRELKEVYTFENTLMPSTEGQC